MKKYIFSLLILLSVALVSKVESQCPIGVSATVASEDREDDAMPMEDEDEDLDIEEESEEVEVEK